ncbi:hypothetical protein JAAARDRAFT_41595 [Jaapia argillacea MUCL 33604]|uniref:Uncharacterized protein n=1 Tax=Jaapia argillacea MUCL 33604 TaxID=933084 RepID=A0A067PAY8_9AGAM|nr:hypothetical protein JAAARDRAFT_41595 [Jaapia argillacea MUCL 33604]
MRNIFSNLLVLVIKVIGSDRFPYGIPYNALEHTILPLFKTLCQGNTTSQSESWVKALSDELHSLRVSFDDVEDIGYYLTPGIRSNLSTLIRGIGHNDTLPEMSNLASCLRQFQFRPFVSLYGEFLREWLWLGYRPAGLGIIKSIGPRRRKQLCHQLMQLLLQSQCSIQDVVKVADQDIACNDEISTILTELLSGLCGGDAGAHELVEEAFGVISKQRPSLLRRKGLPGIWKGASLSDWPYPGSRGQVKAFDPGLRHKFEECHSLHFDPRYCSWTKITHLSSLSARYKAIVLEGVLQDQYICAVEMKNIWDSDYTIFSTDLDDISIPEAILRHSKHPVYVLTGRNRDDGSKPYSWEKVETGDFWW